MRIIPIFLLLSIPTIFISGCITQVQTTEETGSPTVQSELEEKVETGVTEETGSIVQPEIEEKTETEVTSTEASEPRTFHVDIVQGFGITEGAG